jgi:hypothetical protein
MSGISAKKVLLVTVTILSLAGMVMGSAFFPANVAWSKDEEIGSNQVQGKVTQFRTRARKGTIVVKSDKTGKTYTFYVGWNTIYTPRYPGIGETIKVTYINDRGILKATQVVLVPGS